MSDTSRSEPVASLAPRRSFPSLVPLSLDDTRWLAFVSARIEATGFHHPAWAMLLAESYSLRGTALAVLDEAGSVVSGVPVLQAPRAFGRSRRWASLPFTDALVPLGDEHDTVALASALEAWRVAQGIERIELRAALPGAHPAPSTAYSHILPLATDPAVVESQFAASVRRNIRGSERRGVTVVRVESELELTTTYFGLHSETRRRLGVMPQPKRFFRLLWERMLSRDLGFALLALHDARPIAGAVFLSWNDSVIFKYGASDNAYWNLRPNDALMAEAIRIGCLQGRGKFDFGRSDASAEGLRRFKRGWGAHELPLTYSVIGHSPQEIGELRERLERLTGTIVKHSPAWVARAGGRLMYRYAA
jgi:CelD/BcsL family acetyltransferase involved in cellulose biosynthesis